MSNLQSREWWSNALIYGLGACVVAVFALMAIGAVTMVARWFMRWLRDGSVSESADENLPMAKRASGFSVIPLEDGEGRYRVVGVLRENEAEVVWMIEAMSRANAMAKAEIRGLVVTGAEKL